MQVGDGILYTSYFTIRWEMGYLAKMGMMPKGAGKGYAAFICHYPAESRAEVRLAVYSMKYSAEL